MSKVFYLAGPYTHGLQCVKDNRYEKLTLASALLFKQGFFNFSPITQSHNQSAMTKIGTTWNTWQYFDTEMLKRCDGLIVLTLPGWDMSVGVSAEIKIAKKLGLPIQYMELLGDDTFMLSKEPMNHA